MTTADQMTLDPASPATRPSRLSVEQLIERIHALNPSANPEYLESFEPRALVNYLDHLEYAHRPRGREACWSRRPETPAIVCAKVTIAA